MPIARNPEIVRLTETWLGEELDSSVLDVPEYFVFRQDRDSRGGGVAILVKKCLNPELVESYSAMGTEAIVVDERVL